MGSNFGRALGVVGSRSDGFDKEAAIRPRRAVADGLVGLEHEFFAYGRRSLLPLGHAECEVGYRDLFDRLGRMPGIEIVCDAQSRQAVGARFDDGYEITLEPGGQIELVMPPCRSVRDAMRGAARTLAQLERATGDDLVFLSHGTNPLFSGDHPFFEGKHRFSVLRDYIESRRDPRLLALHGATASLQINLDIPGDAEDWADAFRLSYDLRPALAAALDNAFFDADGHPGARALRAYLWDACEPTRSGFTPPAAGDPANAYVEWALDQDCLLLSHALDGPRRRRGTTFREWECCGHDGIYPTSEDWRLHLGLLWPIVRPRRFLEIRYVDAPTFADASAIAVFFQRLLANRDVRRRVRETLASGRASLAAIVECTTGGDAWEDARLDEWLRAVRRPHPRDAHEFVSRHATAHPSAVLAGMTDL